jgi:hypothetical protein
MKTFGAPWGAFLIITTVLGSAVCIAIPLVITWEAHNRLALWLCWLPLLIVVACAFFTIRGYTVGPGALYVERLFWVTRVSLWGLQSATFEPHAMRWSIRTFGNGGLFSISGRFWRRRLGCFSAFVTDLKRTVVLRFPDHTVVVSPSLPEQFAYDICSSHG